MDNNQSDYPEHVSVLIVDDEPLITQSLQRLLRCEPFTLYCADSGQEGLALLGNLKNVALIISDQRMPGLSGSEFLFLSRQLAPDAVRMLLTGYSDINDTISAMNEGGVSRYMAKPWQDMELVQAVRESIERYRLHQDNCRQQLIISAQNEELQRWNSNLKGRVLAQTAQLRKQIEELQLISRQREEVYLGAITALAALIEVRRPKSQLHAANTAALATNMATLMGLPAQEIETIRTAALLHDVGKNAMSDIGLASTLEDMNDEDRRHYFEHPVLAQTSIDSIEILRPAGILIRHHHEKHDGTGFPDRLSGTDIPRGSAILSMADRFDQELQNFNGVNAIERALEKMGRFMGTHFDPLLFPFMEKAAHEVFGSRYISNADSFVELEISPSRLRPGMILSKDLFSSSGLFLLGSGCELRAEHIASLQRIFAIDPLKGGVPVAIRTDVVHPL